jgi:8-oxo-dGTP pyrophosphatase MutT (NUDIX family)
LNPDNAVAALLLLEDGRYVMQLRDAKPDIFYPDHWGCFGGAVHDDEDPQRALCRELQEELEFVLAEAREFTRFDFDFTRLGQRSVYRIYYEVPVSAPAFSRFALHEGAQVRAFSASEILSERRVTPYDAFAIWLHYRRDRFRP